MFVISKKLSLFKKLSLLIILAFISIFFISNVIIGVSYYNYFEDMIAEKLSQTVKFASFAHVQSFFDTMKREALKLVKEEPLTAFWEGRNDANSTKDFLKYRTDVSVSEFIEIYSASRGETISYDEPSDSFQVSKASPHIDFGESDCVFLPVIVPQDKLAQPNDTKDHYTIIYQKIAEDGSYIATGLSAHVTRNVILSGLILPTNISYSDIINGTANNTGSNIYLLNSDGVILSDYFLKFTGQSLTQFNFYSDFKNSIFDDDHRVFNYDQSSYLMSCAYQQKPGLYVVGVIQKQDIIAAVTPTFLMLCLLIFIALTIFCSLCIWLLYRAFYPYEKLVKKVSETKISHLDGAELLDEAIEKGAAAEQKAYEMVLNDYILDREIDLDTISDIEQQFPGEYIPVACKIDDYDSTSPDTLHKCCEVVENMFCFTGKVLRLHMDKNKLLFILCGNITENNVTDVLMKCQNTLKQSGISTSYIIGKTQNQLKDINNSYYSMQKTIFMSVCYGSGSILSDCEDEDHVKIPANAIPALIGYINTCDKKKTVELLDQIFDDFDGQKSSLIPIYLLQVTLSIICHIAAFYSDRNIFDYQEVIDRVTEVSSLSAAKKLISQFCFDACDYLTSLQNKTRSKQDIETNIIEYLNENYSNPNLSLTFLSNIFGYSPKYLGRIFKISTNMFFTQYLTELRMKKARELILETELPIAEIFELVGITTLQHFYRLFKKQYGYSPAAMRKNSHNHSLNIL